MSQKERTIGAQTETFLFSFIIQFLLRLLLVAVLACYERTLHEITSYLKNLLARARLRCDRCKTHIKPVRSREMISRFHHLVVRQPGKNETLNVQIANENKKNRCVHSECACNCVTSVSRFRISRSYECAKSPWNVCAVAVCAPGAFCMFRIRN